MPQTAQTVTDIAVAEFFQGLATWIADGKPTKRPFSTDLLDIRCRKSVLPFAVLATRSNDRHQDVADLIDNTVAEILGRKEDALDPATREILKDLEESLDALCYVGFRRARLVSAPQVFEMISRTLETTYQDLPPNDKSRRGSLPFKDFRYLMLTLGLCRARFDTVERHLYESICVRVLTILRDNATRHLTAQHVYQIIRWFAYPARLHPKTYSRIQPLAIDIGRAFFARREYFVPSRFRTMNQIERLLFSAFREAELKIMSRLGRRHRNPNTLLKDVAIATAIGRPQYGMAVLDYLQWQRRRETDKTRRGRLQTQMVETSVIAGNDEFYGLWNNTYRKFLLNNKFDTFSPYIVAQLQRFGRYGRALNLLRKRKRSTLSLKNDEAFLLRYMGRFDEAAEKYAEIDAYAAENLLARASDKPPADRFTIMSRFWPSRTSDELEYIRSVHTLLQSCPRGVVDDSVVVICPSSFSAFTQMPVHALAELRSRGCSIISLLPGCIQSDEVSPDIDENVSNSIFPHYLSDKATLKKVPSQEWVFDPEKKNIAYNGINFYYTIHNTMGIIFRCYDVAWRDPIVLGHVRRYQVAIEAMFDKHERLVRFSQETGRKVKVILTEIQQGISHALRLIAETAGSHDYVELFHICNGFEAYHSNLVRSQSAQFQCIANVSRHPEVSLAYRPSVHVYREWFTNATPEQKASAEALAYATRVDETAVRRPLAEELRFPGRPIIVLLGKILPDLARPNDYGFLHSDIKEWLADCCQFAHTHQINLLLKPHPDETKSQVSLYVNQEFVELLEDVPKEFHPIILDRRAYPIPALRDWADGVLMWGGNSSVELGLLGIPSMICGYYGSMDVPVGHLTPDTRERFEEFLLGKIDKELLADVRSNTIAFLSYVLHPNHTMPSRFNNRSMYNAEVWPPVLHPSTKEVSRTAEKMADYILGDATAIVPPSA
ncbi:hypothetical protein [Ciceribacter azotifigens]|uniref:hypothetical protein n=1 Tax=Ciceribacter azotifigens TaxID=2069303 RepID=UPI003A8C5311